MTSSDRKSIGAGGVRHALVMAGTVALLFGCPGPEVLVFDDRIAKLAGCIECATGEQAAVVAMGDTAIPALRRLLIQGPLPAALARRDSVLRAPYRDSLGIMRVTPAHIVDRRLDDFRTMHRVRASLTLGLIGGDSARRALCDARATQVAPDVRRFIDSALVLLSGSCP